MPSSEHSGTSKIPRFEAVSFREPETARQSLDRASAKLSTALAGMLPALLADSPDPDSALLLFDRLASEASAEALRLIEKHPFLAHYAIAVFGHSWYLGETLIRNPDLLHTFLREKKLDLSFSREEFSEALARFRSRSFERDGSLLLARFKKREYVRIMLRDVLKISPLAETTAEISALSDVLIEEALREAESNMERRFRLPQHLDAEGRTVNTPFTVLSLGKLGGNELNYSSDIDLLFLYGDGSEPPTAPISNREYFVRLAQEVTEILSRPNAEGAVFRIDLRLRPQGNEGELAISLSKALHYYAVSAHDWERQALIKVRYSAGSETLAREFIRKVQPQVYKEEINFAAIKTALLSREKIDRRRRRHPPELQTIDVKIDRGGIRDIEFLVQCLQRVYGGAEPWLRSGGTLFSLQKLHDKRHISGRDFHELTSAYTFLRHLEHRLQLRRGQQIHRLPASICDLQALQRSIEALGLGGYRPADLAAVVRERMAVVAAIYQRIIYQQQTRRSFEPSTDEFRLQSRSEIAIADQSHQQLLEKLAEDAPSLYQVLKAERPGSHERRNVLRFLSSAYSSSERYASLLRDQNAIIRALPLFESSEYVSEILVRHPEEISSLIDISAGTADAGSGKLFDGSFEDRFPGHDPVFSYLPHSSVAHGEKIALLRRQFRHCMFVSGARDIAELRPIYSSLAQTTSAAEDALAAAFGIAESPKGFAVLALGRLGSREFDLLSDADLLFVGDEAKSRQLLTRTAEELIQALSAYTQEGMVFPVDTRLRPRGGDGELVIAPKHLEEYFATEAQSWEALMYTKLRFICGDSKLGQRAQAAAEALFRRFANDGDFASAVRQMRQKLQDASAPEKSIRTSAGGLYDIDFISSFLLVKHGIRPKLGTLRDRLWRCSGTGVIDKKDAAALDHAAELGRTVEHVLRLVIGRNVRWLPSATHARQACEKLTSEILRQDFPTGLEQKLSSTFLEVRQIYDRVLT
jgi:glutamate-ammonia-ligase adenylyltransferase